jgi:hypothetical protein
MRAKRLLLRGATMREFGRFAQYPRRILSIAWRIVLEHHRCSGAGIGDRDGVGFDGSGGDTEDRATRLDVRMAVRTVAAVPRRYRNYIHIVLENFVPRCDLFAFVAYLIE